MICASFGYIKPAFISRMKNLKTLFTLLILDFALIVCPVSQTRLHGENTRVRKPLRKLFNQPIVTSWVGRRIYLHFLVVKVELLSRKN